MKKAMKNWGGAGRRGRSHSRRAPEGIARGEAICNISRASRGLLTRRAKNDVTAPPARPTAIAYVAVALVLQPSYRSDLLDLGI